VATIPALRVRPPEGFAALPLYGSEQQRIDEARKLVEQAQAAGQPVDPDFAQHVLAVGERFASFNIRLMGTFAVSTPEGPATANAVLAVQELESPRADLIAKDRSQAATALRNLIQARTPGAEVSVVDLPCGPTVAAVILGEFRVPGEKTGKSEETVIPVHRAQFTVVAPSGRHLVILDVNTPSEKAWPTVAEQAVAMARSIEFVDAQVEQQEAAVPSTESS